MKYTTLQLTEKHTEQFKKNLLPAAARLLAAGGAQGWGIVDAGGTALGCLVAAGNFLQSIYVVPEARRCGLGRALVAAWEADCRAKYDSAQELVCTATLPAAEWTALAGLFQACGFADGEFLGEVYTFNPYRICRSKFISKTFQRGKPYLPPNWRVVRYSDLNAQERALLESNKARFPDSFDYDYRWEQLDLSQSFAFFAQSEQSEQSGMSAQGREEVPAAGESVVGFITQQRLSANIASVVMFAVNPVYRGAGLYILKYYMFALHFETPEIFQLRCFFSKLTDEAKKLFLIYTEEQYSRHALLYKYTKNLRDENGHRGTYENIQQKFSC